MTALLHEGLLNAVAADVTAERRPLPCALLRIWLRTGKRPRCSRAHADQMLLLAAVEHALLAAVAADWHDVPTAPLGRLENDQTLKRPKLVLAGRFAFVPAPSSGLHMARATYTWLSTVPVELVHAAVRWAPAVVAPVEDPDGPVPVLGNLPTAFLARQAAPDEKVWVRVLQRPATFKVTLPELAAAVLPQLTRIVAPHRDRIVRAAPTVRAAEQVTGLQRAMVFRIRQRAGRGSR